MRQILRTQGAAPLFKGVSPVFYGYLFSSMVYFVVYAKFKQWTRGDFEKPKEAV